VATARESPGPGSGWSLSATDGRYTSRPSRILVLFIRLVVFLALRLVLALLALALLALHGLTILI
jgi:hypothetical protein